MKKSKELLLLQGELLNHAENMEILTAKYMKKIKQEYTEMMIEEKNKLLQKIADGEKLDINKLRVKYLKSKEYITKPNVVIDNEELLDKIDINGNTFYYEHKENGSVFDVEYKQVGSYVDQQFVFNT